MEIISHLLLSLEVKGQRIYLYISIYGGTFIMGDSFLTPPTFCVHVGGAWDH